MSNFKEAWPLAFVLAVAAGSSQCHEAVDTQPTVFFQAGSLAAALNSIDSGKSEGRSGVAPIQLSQWFNFANCFSGVWRRC